MDLKLYDPLFSIMIPQENRNVLTEYSRMVCSFTKQIGASLGLSSELAPCTGEADSHRGIRNCICTS